MANILMPPIVLQAAPGVGVEPKAQLPVKEEGSFAQHLERQFRGEQAGKNKLLGVQAKLPKAMGQVDEQKNPTVAVEALLQQLMVELKDMVRKTDSEAGQWRLQPQDLGLLEKFAAQAGVDAATLATLKQQLEVQGGLSLADLCAALEGNFQPGLPKQQLEVQGGLPLADLPAALEESFQPGFPKQHLEVKFRGVQAEQSKPFAAPAVIPQGNKLTGEGQIASPATVEVLLQQLIAGLKDMASKPETAAGQWSFQLKDMGLLEKLGAQVGMDAAKLTVLKQQLAVQGGLTLADLPVALGETFQPGLPKQHLEVKFMGVPAEQSKPFAAPAVIPQGNKLTGEGQIASPATVEVLLQQLMAGLKDMASKPETTAGQWSFQLKDMGLLEKLGAQVGMEAAKLTVLKKQLEEQGGLPLADLFAALEENFKELGAATQVTVEETYLPLLETLLSKLGVAPEAIKQLDSQGVNGVDQLDLIAYLRGLQALQNKAQAPLQGQPESGPATIVLTAWEFEQFSAMLVEAGVPTEEIEAMFPEKMPLWQKAVAGLRPEQGEMPVEMSLERLTGILRQALAAVDETRPRVDVPKFFNELNTVLTQAGFQSSDVGWTPVVQGTMKAAYEELQKMVDQGKGRDEKWIEIMGKNEAADEHWQMSGGDQALEVLAIGQEGDTLDGEVLGGQAPDALALNRTDHVTEPLNPGAIEMRAPELTPTGTMSKVQAPPRMQHFSAEMQQFTVEQISQGVLRGLKNHEHHLTLTLYPKELGEVKVDLQVRGSQLSATFVMENQKVKEAMESNLGEFKDNLERRGFSLGAMSVSVGQQGHSNEGGQRFASTWEQSLMSQSQEKNIPPGVSTLEFIRNDQATLRQGGISIFV